MAVAVSGWPSRNSEVFSSTYEEALPDAHVVRKWS